MVGDKVTTDYWLDIKLSIFKNNDLLEIINSKIENRIRTIVYGNSFGLIGYMKKFHSIYEVNLTSDILVFDGRLFFYFCKFIGKNVSSNISLPELVFLLLNYASKKHKRVFLLGSTTLLNKKAVDNVTLKYEGISQIDGINGYFNEKDEEKIIKKINSFQPDILFIGISSPQKEELILKWGEKINSPIIVLCGGMIDVLAGKEIMTPKFLKSLGVASFFRLIQNPKLAKRYLIIINNLSYLFAKLFFYNLFGSSKSKKTIRYIYKINHEN